MKLQAREQSFIGVAAIAAVVIVLLFGIFADFGILPQWDKFNTVRQQLTTANQTVATQENDLARLKDEEKMYDQEEIKMPEGKIVLKVDKAEGETLESTRRFLLNTVIEMSQKPEYNNVLISAKPLPKPKPPPTPVAPVDPNAPPELQLSDLIDEIPYEIKIRGSYSSLNNFINELAKFDTVIEISRIEINIDKADAGRPKDPSRPLEATFKINYIIDKT